MNTLALLLMLIPSPEARVPVSITAGDITPEGEFIDPEAEERQKGLNDSVKDLKDRFKKSKVVEIVEAGAVVEVRVVDRYAVETGDVSIRHNVITGTEVSRDMGLIVETELFVSEKKVATIKTPLCVSSLGVKVCGAKQWKAAADWTKDKIEEWVKANRSKLMGQ